MKKLLALLALATFWVQAAPKEVAIDQSRAAIINVPAAWTLSQPSYSKSLPMAGLSISAPDHKIVLQLFGSKDGKPFAKTPMELKSMARKDAQKYIRGSSEKNANLVDVSKHNIAGSYARFTDERWVSVIPPMGQYKYVTKGMFQSNGILIAVEYLSNDIGSDRYYEAMEIIKGIQGKG